MPQILVRTKNASGSLRARRWLSEPRGGFLAGSVRFSERTRRSIFSTFSASPCERGIGKAREERCPRWFSVSPQNLVRTKNASGSLRARRWLSEPRGGFLAGSVRFSEPTRRSIFSIFSAPPCKRGTGEVRERGRLAQIAFGRSGRRSRSETAFRAFFLVEGRGVWFPQEAPF